MISFSRGTSTFKYFLYMVSSFTRFVFLSNINRNCDTRDKVSNEVEQRRDTLESKGFKLRRLKTKYLKCCFNE